MSGFGNKSPWDNRAISQMGGMNNYQQQGMMQQSMNTLQSNMNQSMQSISYPTPRSNQSSYGNMMAQQQNSMGGQSMMNQQQGGAQNNRVFTGTVTKLHDNFGFVDDDVFFQTSVVKGQVPRVGDRVLTEAMYNVNMPFKWNATRITPLPGSGGTGLLGSGGNNQPMNRGFGDMAGGRDRNRDRPPRPARSPAPRRDDNRRNDRERMSRKRSRSQSKSRTSRSPPRRRARHQPRYHVSVPKVSLNFPNCNVMDLKKRYSSLYIPSDFFKANHNWTEAFPIESPFHIRFRSAFQVMDKEQVEPLVYNKFQFDPEDADYTYVAKVMLLAAPELEELYEKTCHLIEKDSEDKDPRDNLVHPSRALKFLVGLKGKSETMAIGGPWSPSQDGADPLNDPSVLIKTAIRTCGAMTGIDLSGCTNWTKFLEIHYRRQPTSSKPARTETVVIFLPDVWSNMPSKMEYDSLCEKYAQKCEMKLEGKCVTPQEFDTSEADTSVAEDDEEGGESIQKGEPTHWKELDPKTMKVNELKGELEARGQNSKGLKSQLQARLQKIIQSEKDAEEKKSQEDTEETEEVTEENKEEEVSDEVKQLDDKAKDKIKSCYKTPTSPCLFVHPNTKVKSGKFDCRVESLSVLLDYRSDDNKEGTFELSLFAELFNEMLMRDNAFKIYKAIVNAPVKAKEDKKDKTDDKKDKSEDKEQKGEDEKEKEEKEKKEKEEKEKKEKNMITRNKELLLGCTYFDLSHIGYFEAKDLEDIFLTLELELSRAEVKKLAAKLAGHKDHVNYRALVDVEVGAPEQEEVADGKSDKELASGFKQLVPGSQGAAHSSTSSSQPLETNKLVKFRGAVLDIEKLVDKMDKAESVRSATESRLVTIQKELSACKDHSDKYLAQRDKLTAELKDSRDKTRSLEVDLMGSRGEAARYLAAIKDVFFRVQPMAAPPKKEEPKENGIEDKKEAVKVETAEPAASKPEPAKEAEPMEAEDGPKETES